MPREALAREADHLDKLGRNATSGFGRVNVLESAKLFLSTVH